MKKLNIKKLSKDFLLMTIGSVLYAVGIALMLDPNQLAPGGVVGISIIVNYITNIPTGTIILLINIPLMLLAWWKFGIKMIISTMYVTVFSSYLMNLLDPIGALTSDLFIAACFGNALVAVGMVLIFKAGATSGGTDILVKLIKTKFRHASTGTIFLITDAVVVACAMAVFRDFEVGLYAVLAMVVFTIVFDKTLYSADGGRFVHIISEKYQEIAERIMSELEIGVTYVQGTGAYTNAPKQVILCAMKKHMLPRVQDIVKEVDPIAFMIVESASEVWGEGHKDHHSERI